MVSKELLISIILFLNLPFIGNNINLDIPYSYQISFQDPITPAAIAIQDLHHNIMIYLAAIFVFVLYLLSATLYLFRKEKNPISDTNFIENFYFEIFITLYSALLIFAIIYPSTVVMYTIDYFYTIHLTVKIVGAQWFWRYIYGDYVSQKEEGISFQSNILPLDELKEGDIFNLAVDQPLVLPCHVPISFLITSQDVIHSFALPSAGIKMDAIPGRINSIVTVFNRTGTITGQCSELCGVGHSKMPIQVQVVDMSNFLKFVENQ